MLNGIFFKTAFPDNINIIHSCITRNISFIYKWVSVKFLTFAWYVFLMLMLWVVPLRDISEGFSATMPFNDMTDVCLETVADVVLLLSIADDVFHFCQLIFRFEITCLKSISKWINSSVRCWVNNRNMGLQAITRL